MTDIQAFGMILIGLDLISIAVLGFIISYIKDGKDLYKL